MDNQTDNKHFIKNYYIIFKAIIFFCICFVLFLGCSSKKNSTNKYIEQIKTLNTQISTLKMQVDQSNTVINDLKLEMENLERSNLRNASLLESLQWIQEIAFDNRECFQITNDNEDEIVKKVIAANIIKANTNQIILTIGLSNENGNIYDIECLVYEKVDLMNESGGYIKTICFTIEKNNNGLKLIK